MEIQLDTATDQSILSALRQGDARRAASMLVRYYGNSIFGLCRTLVNDLEQAEDLTQESFARAFSRMNGIQGAPSVRGWLMGVTQQCCAERLEPSGCPQDGEASCSSQAAERAGWKISESLQRRLEVLASSL